MATRQNYQRSRLVEQWTNAAQTGDPAPAGYTAWDLTGNITAQRALTTDETASLAMQDTVQTATANQATLQSRAQAALVANGNFVGQNKPGTASAQASQAYDQAVTLSKECTAVIRLLLDLLDSTAGT